MVFLLAIFCWYIVGLISSLTLLAYCWYEGEDITGNSLIGCFTMAILGVLVPIMFLIFYLEETEVFGKLKDKTDTTLENFSNKTIFKGRK